MSVRLLISARPGETLGALLEDDRLVWFDFIRTLHETAPPLPPGAVCLGRVRKVERGLQAAFVDLGGGEPALLRARDARPPARGETAKPPIEKLVHEGEAVLVQISRLGRDGKGPRVTADLRLPAPAGTTVPPEGESKSPLRAQIEARARSARAPQVLWRPPEPDPAVALMRQAPQVPDEIETDHEAAAASLRKALNGSRDAPELRVRRDDVFRAHGIDEDVAELSAPLVTLESGGSLIIEPTAALTAVDVNAGAALGSTAEDTAFRVNLAAAREIPRQIALRRLGGIVVVDFLRLKAARHRREVVAALKGGAEARRIEATVSGFSAAGLVEIVVPRTGTPLHERLLSSCPACSGRGAVPARINRALALLALLSGEARRGGATRLEARAAPEIVGWLESRAEDVARELERFAVANVCWRAEPEWPPDRMEVRRA